MKFVGVLFKDPVVKVKLSKVELELIAECLRSRADGRPEAAGFGASAARLLTEVEDVLQRVDDSAPY